MCPVQTDSRFLVIMHLPNDVETREALMAIRRDPRPREGAACPLHGYRGAAAQAAGASL